MASLGEGVSSGNGTSSKSVDNWRFVQSSMATGIRWKRGWLCGLAALVMFILMVFYISATSQNPLSNLAHRQWGRMKTSSAALHPNWFWSRGYTEWPQFSSSPLLTNEYFVAHCAKNSNYSVMELVNIAKAWNGSQDQLCQNLYKKFDAIFSIEARKAHLSIPPTFKKKVSRWLNNKPELIQELYNQNLVYMVSKFTREHTAFNPLRDKRPVQPPSIPEQKYVDEIVEKTRSSCDFCQYKQMTAEHVFGRLESEHAFTASNVFKVDSLHALVALKKHHPLNWSQEQFLDLMRLSVQWLKKAKHNHQDARFPSLIWDVLPKCGASQVHPHMQVMFDHRQYHGPIELWREGAQDYYNTFGANYFSDLVSVYSALGLAVTHGKAVAFASLVPKKDHEVVVMAAEADDDFFNLLYYTLRAFVDDTHAFCYSMGIGYPALGDKEGRIPAFARIITRGAVTDIRADISSLELFVVTNVNIDPWKTTQLVRNSVNKRAATSVTKH